MTNEKPIQPKQNLRQNHRKGIAFAIALVAAGVGILLKECLQEKKSQQAAATAQTDAALQHQKFQAFKSHFPAIAAPERTDAGAAAAQDAEPFAPPSKSELASACDALVQTTGSNGDTYEAFRKVGKAMPSSAFGTEWSISAVQKACFLKIADMARIIGRGIQNEDGRLAQEALDYIEFGCLDTDIKNTTAKAGEEFQELRSYGDKMRACAILSDTDPRRDCYSSQIERHKEKCLTENPQATNEETRMCILNEKSAIHEACDHLNISPSKQCIEDVKAEEKAAKVARKDRLKEKKEECRQEGANMFGVDIEDIRSLAAQNNANILATRRLDLLNPGVTPDLLDCELYGVALRNIVVYERNSALLRRLGVADIENFKQQYIDAVVARLDSAGNENAEKCAAAIKTVWILRDVIQGD